MYNTRIAPSPTGDMHLGTARTAYFNWLAARASGGSFMLRIDDTDLARSRPEYVDVILRTMEWLGLDYDRVVRQSERFADYRAYAEAMLVRRGWAGEEGGAVVLRLGRGRFPESWHDEISGDIPITERDVEAMDGMVLIKSDGSPSYNFSSVVDDMEFGINCVIRGVDHVSNTCRQVVLWNILNPDCGPDFDPPLPKFYHVGLIASGGKLLSKRDGAASMLQYRERGVDPDAMLNFLARLGWGPKVDDKTTALLPRERMLELFLSGGSMRNSQANMDLKKLESFDRKYKARKKIWRNGDRIL